MTPYTSVMRGIAPEAFCEAIEDARIAAEKELGITLRWIFDIPGEAGLAGAEETLRIATEIRPDGLVGFGLGGPEIGVPRPQFKPYFDAALAAGSAQRAARGRDHRPGDDLGRPAGAEAPSGSATVRRRMQDPALVDYLGEHRIPLEVSPTSNLATRAVASYDEHPLRGDGRGRTGRHDQLRRPADVRHRPHQRVRRRRPTCSNSTPQASADLARTAVQVSFADDTTEGRPAWPRSTRTSQRTA